MPKAIPPPSPVPQPVVPAGARLVPVTGRAGGSQRAIIAWIIVDEADYPLISARRWSFAGKGYVRTGVNSTYVHQLLLPGSPQVDHINGDKLDNRRSNLRPATNAQNHQGHSSRAPGESGYRGVTRSGKGWEARVRVNGVVYRQRGFSTPEAAAKARDELARQHHGEFAQASS